MAALLPAAPHAVLSEKEVALCLHHYATEVPVRTWISDSDTAPALVWDNSEATARASHEMKRSPRSAQAQSVTPAPPTLNSRWRDRYLSHHLPTQAERVATVTKRETEYVLIADDDDEDEGCANTQPSPASSQPLAKSAAPRAAKAATPRTDASVSPSPHRSTATGGGVSASQASRLSTGSSVVVLSQPAVKAVEKARRGRPATASKSTSRGREGEQTGEEATVGKKRQRSMEEFLFRGT